MAGVNLNPSIPPIQAPEVAKPPSGESGASAGSFGDLFRQSIEKVEQYHQTAAQSIERFLSGEQEELHKVAIATQQAELAFEMFLQVRNKVVNAYQEVMRMQL